MDIPAQAEIHRIVPGESIQQRIDQAKESDVLILKEGVYHERLNIHKPITLKAANPGEATVTGKYSGPVRWQRATPRSQIWYANGIDWPVHWLLVEGIHAFDYRNKDNFMNRVCGPYWSKGWQEGKSKYTVPPLYFAHDAANDTLWLQMDDSRNPNELEIHFNTSGLDGETLVQKDLGTYWNQQEIVVVSKNPPVHPLTMWYKGTAKNPGAPRHINFPKICGIVIDINADNVVLEGLRIHIAPTVGVEINNSRNVLIQDCYFSGHQYAINTGYECTKLTVKHCEMDGGLMYSYGRHRNVTLNMWNHSTYINPIKFNGVGLVFQHNYVYEGFDLFHPRGRHRNFPHIPDLRSDVSFNVWHNAIDNVAEFDGVEARMNVRFHHNLIISDHDALAITTTENGGPLSIDHNIWWPGGGRIMKLTGTGRLTTVRTLKRTNG